MKTIKQIGNAALLRVFKPGLTELLVPKFGGGLTPLRRTVNFPKEILDIFKPLDRRGESICCRYLEGITLTTLMAIWGIELGLIYFEVADGENIIETITKIQGLKEKKITPSHIVKINNEDDDLGAQYISIYRLSQKQEESIVSRLKNN